MIGLSLAINHKSVLYVQQLFFFFQTLATFSFVESHESNNNCRFDVALYQGDWVNGVHAHAVFFICQMLMGDWGEWYYAGDL